MTEQQSNETADREPINEQGAGGPGPPADFEEDIPVVFMRANASLSPKSLSITDSPDLENDPVLVVMHRDRCQDKGIVAGILRAMADAVEVSRYPLTKEEAQAADAETADADAKRR